MTHTPHPTDALPVPNIIKTAPDRIYLILGDGIDGDEDFSALEEVTWCQDKQNETDIEYVRADVGRREGYELAMRTSPPPKGDEAMDSVTALLATKPHFDGVMTPEPSLRALIYRYYSCCFENKAEADELARKYIASLAAQQSKEQP